MLTLKFGGTSMGNARRILSSADIIINRAKEDRLSVVVSAVAGVSNTLQAAIDSSVTGTTGTFVSDLRKTHQEIAFELQSKCEGFDAEKVLAFIEPNFVELEKLLAGVASFGECPDTVYCRIMGMGELLSAPMMEAVLRAKKKAYSCLIPANLFIQQEARRKVRQITLKLLKHVFLIVTVKIRVSHVFFSSLDLYVHTLRELVQNLLWDF